MVHFNSSPFSNFPILTFNLLLSVAKESGYPNIQFISNFVISVRPIHSCFLVYAGIFANSEFLIRIFTLFDLFSQDVISYLFTPFHLTF